jgi:hypothetical protein
MHASATHDASAAQDTQIGSRQQCRTHQQQSEQTYQKSYFHQLHMPWSSSLTPHAHAKQCIGSNTHAALQLHTPDGSAGHARQLHTRVNRSHCTRMSSPLVWIDQLQHMHTHHCHQQHTLARVSMHYARISSTQWHANQPHTVARVCNTHA